MPGAAATFNHNDATGRRFRERRTALSVSAYFIGFRYYTNAGRLFFRTDIVCPAFLFCVWSQLMLSYSVIDPSGRQAVLRPKKETRKHTQGSGVSQTRFGKMVPSGDVNIARRKLHGILCVTPRLKRCARLPPKSGRQRNIRARNGQ